MQKAFRYAAIAVGALASCAHAGVGSVIGSPLKQAGRQLIVQVPEPSSPVTLAVDLLSVAAVVFLICRWHSAAAVDRSRQ